MNKKIYFITQAKGGAGKSVLTFMLAEKYKEAVILDLDDATTTSIKQLAYRKPIKVSFLDPTMLEIWLQQWPRLRRSFSFCTGAIYPRNIAGKYFDLQICPEKFERSVTVASSTLVIEPDSSSARSPKPVWVTVACADLQYPSELRPFLRGYGADVEGTREGFSKLVNSYVFITSLNDESSVLSLVLALSAIYPKESDGETLKLDMLQNRSLKAGYHHYFKESDVLLALATTESFESFNYDKLNFIERFLAIYNNQSSEAIKLLNQLLKHDINPWGEKLLERIATNLTESEFETFAGMFDKKLAFALASQNSQLLYSETFWRRYKNDHGELLSILLRYGETHQTGSGSSTF